MPSIRSRSGRPWLVPAPPAAVPPTPRPGRRHSAHREGGWPGRPGSGGRRPGSPAAAARSPPPSRLRSSTAVSESKPSVVKAGRDADRVRGARARARWPPRADQLQQDPRRRSGREPGEPVGESRRATGRGRSAARRAAPGPDRAAGPAAGVRAGLGRVEKRQVEVDRRRSPRPSTARRAAPCPPPPRGPQASGGPGAVRPMPGDRSSRWPRPTSPKASDAGQAGCAGGAWARRRGRRWPPRSWPGPGSQVPRPRRRARTQARSARGSARAGAAPSDLGPSTASSRSGVARPATPSSRAPAACTTPVSGCSPGCRPAGAPAPLRSATSQATSRTSAPDRSQLATSSAQRPASAARRPASSRSRSPCSRTRCRRRRAQDAGAAGDQHGAVRVERGGHGQHVLADVPGLADEAEGRPGRAARPRRCSGAPEHAVLEQRDDLAEHRPIRSGPASARSRPGSDGPGTPRRSPRRRGCRSCPSRGSRPPGASSRSEASTNSPAGS